MESASAGDHAVPDDLRITLKSAARLPGEPYGPETVTIQSDGRTELSRKDGPDGLLPAMEMKLDPSAVRRIYDAIVADRFFELKPNYSDPHIHDGDYASMSITADGKTHRVRTVNIKVHAFDRIVLAIDRELPDGREVFYNALHRDDYLAVER